MQKFRHQFCILGHRFLGVTTKPAQNHLTPERAPENTLKALQKLIKGGGQGAEFDVILSKDDVPVVIHGRRLNECIVGADPDTDSYGFVEDYTAVELQKFDVGHGEAIPTLVEVIDLTLKKNPEFLFNIELKGYACAAKTFAVLQPYIDDKNLKAEQVLFSSFDHGQLVEMYSIARSYDFRYGLLFELNAKPCVNLHPHTDSEAIYQHFSVEYVEKMATKLPLYSLHPYWEDITSELVTFAQKHNLTIAPWTSGEAHPDVDKSIVNRMHALRTQGVTLHIITDYPIDLKTFFAQ